MSLYKGTTPSARRLSGKVEGFPTDFSEWARVHEMQEIPVNELDDSASAR
jgi:hypothetical protein